MKEKVMTPSPLGMFFQEMLRGEIYKRTQGRMTRQITCIAVWAAIAWLAYRLWDTVNWAFAERWFSGGAMSFKYGVPLAVLMIGLWLGFRLVNYAPFADFLIAVEAEMNKVSWPTQTELVRSSIVVIVMIITLTITVFAYDLILHYLLWLCGVVPG